MVGIKPEHDGSAIDAMDDGDEPGENSRRQPKLALDEDEETDAFAASREWFAGAR